jgi:hypothetical protein
MVSVTPTMSDEEYVDELIRCRDWSMLVAFGRQVDYEFTVVMNFTPTVYPASTVKETCRRNITALRSRKRPMLP